MASTMTRGLFADAPDEWQGARPVDGELRELQPRLNNGGPDLLQVPLVGRKSIADVRIAVHQFIPAEECHL